MRKFYISFNIDTKNIYVGHYYNQIKTSKANNQPPSAKFSIKDNKTNFENAILELNGGILSISYTIMLVCAYAGFAIDVSSYYNYFNFLFIFLISLLI